MRSSLITWLALAAVLMGASRAVGAAVPESSRRRAAPAAVPQTQPATDGHSIKLNRPAKVGERYLLRLNWSRTEEDLIAVAGPRNEPRVETRSASADVAGIVEVLEVSPGGTVMRFKLTVADRAKLGLADGSSMHLTAGTVLLASWNGKRAEVAREKEPLSRGAEAVLAQALPLRKIENCTEADDAVYGTRRRHKAGASWEINRASAAGELRGLGFETGENDLKGKGKVVSLAKVNGEPCVNVEVTLRADRLTVAPGSRLNVPVGMSLTEGSFHATLGWALPVQASRRPASEAESTRLVMTFEGTTGPKQEPMKIVRFIRSSRQVERIDLGHDAVAGERN